MSRNARAHRYRQRNCITREHVAALASESFPSDGLEILGFDLKPFSNEKLGYLGVHQLLTIEARERDEPGGKTLRSFFVKTLSPSCNDFQRKVFREEVKFFSDVVPRLLEGFKGEAWSPKCYLGKGPFLILEDLRSTGFGVSNRELTHNQLRSAVACLARLHASSLLLEGKLQRPLGEVYEGYFEEKTLQKEVDENWNWLLSASEVAGAVARKLGLDPKYTSIAHEHLMGNAHLIEGKRNVLSHGDLWRNNMLFNKDATSCRLVDFQMVVYRSYAIDLLQLIHLNASAKTRRRLESELVKLYHAILNDNLRTHDYGGQLVSLDEIDREIEEKRIFGLFFAVQCLPITALNEQFKEEFAKDEDTLRRHMYESRRDFVLNAMQSDCDYRFRIEEVVRELVEFVQLHSEITDTRPY